MTFINDSQTIEPIIDKTAIVLLSYADFESLEITLAAYGKFLPENSTLFILQNGRGSYDCERTYRVAKRYAELYPERIRVVDWIPPQRPYFAIKQLLEDPIMNEYEYICKVDDDTFPLTADWLEKLCKCYERSYAKYGRNLAYVTGLVNNNNFGTHYLIDKLYRDEFFETYARPYYKGSTHPHHECYNLKLCDKDDISPYDHGNSWRNPFISRWIHKKTTMKPNEYIETVKELPDTEIDPVNRYSINCMVFKKEYWNEVFVGSDDDEFSFHMHTMKNKKKIIGSMSTPMVHLFFFSQREENRDMLPEIRAVYDEWLGHPFLISMCPLKEYENENRLKFLENLIREKKIVLPEKTGNPIFSCYSDGKHKIFRIFGIKIKIKK